MCDSVAHIELVKFVLNETFLYQVSKSPDSVWNIEITNIVEGNK